MVPIASSWNSLCFVAAWSGVHTATLSRTEYGSVGFQYLPSFRAGSSLSVDSKELTTFPRLRVILWGIPLRRDEFDRNDSVWSTEFHHHILINERMGQLRVPRFCQCESHTCRALRSCSGKFSEICSLRITPAASLKHGWYSVRRTFVLRGSSSTAVAVLRMKSLYRLVNAEGNETPGAVIVSVTNERVGSVKPAFN